MSAPTAQLAHIASEPGSDVQNRSMAAFSDYGSDIGWEDLDENSQVVGALDTKEALLPSVEFEAGEREDEEQYVDSYAVDHRPSVLRVAKGTQSSPVRERATVEIEYDQESRRSWSVPVNAQRPQAVVGNAETDTRPPLERFRTKPKKPLSVTDLVSPAWCELQYLYTLTKYGRKAPTQAMRAGSKIHQKLEDEVHTSVLVQVQSMEDRFGLRIWNIISGLRCLRETGQTRELGVFGIIQGQVVNGVIDELSYECPDPAMEEQMERSRTDAGKDDTSLLPPGQPGIAEAFAKASKAQAGDETHEDGVDPVRRVYITDVKTRSVPSVPTGASLRPTWMQLMLYRKLLESLSLNTVDAETVFARYNLRPLKPFTKTFLQDINTIGPDNDAASFPNLLSLWSLLITEMQCALPPGSLSPLLRAEFRYAETGEILGSELTVYEDEVIDNYVGEGMAFWKGSREAKGVEIEEAFKCRICNFADDCTWRKAKIEEATEKSRLRREAREMSAV